MPRPPRGPLPLAKKRPEEGAVLGRADTECVRCASDGTASALLGVSAVTTTAFSSSRLPKNCSAMSSGTSDRWGKFRKRLIFWRLSNEQLCLIRRAPSARQGTLLGHGPGQILPNEHLLFRPPASPPFPPPPPFPFGLVPTKMIRSISLQKHSNFWLTCVNGCFTLCRVSKVQIQIAVGQSAIIRAELAVRPFNLFLPALEGMTLIGEGRAGQATKA